VKTFVLQGEQASMNDVAEAAGVARATVYRYFPNREALLDELAANAINDVDVRLASARVDEVAPDEGISRAVRAVVEGGDLFVLLARERSGSGAEQYARTPTEPMRRLFERGQVGGDVRGAIPAAWIAE